MKTREKGKKEEKNLAPLTRIKSWLHTASARCCWILLLGWVILSLTLSLACAPERYALTVGSISRQTIAATKDVVDEITTQEARRAAANAVEPSYRLKEGVSDQVLTTLSQVFDDLRKVQQYGITLREESDTAETVRSRTFTDEEIEYAQMLLSNITLSRYQIITLLRTESADLETMVSTVMTAVQNALNTGIREGRVSESNSTIRQIVGYRVDISLNQNVLTTVLTTALQPNLVIDQEATEAARQRAMDGVEPVVYLQGQNIVRTGEIVRQNQYEMVRSLGLLRDDQVDFTVYGGVIILTAMAVALLALLLRLLLPEALHEPRKTAVMVSVISISTALCAVAVKVMQVYFAPLVLASMLATVLLGWRAGLPATVTMSVLLTGLAAGDSATSQSQMISMLLMLPIGGVFSVFFLHGRPQRLRTMVCGALVGLINIVCLVVMGLMTSINYSVLAPEALYALAGGIIAGIVSVGLQPVFESIFNLATPSKLLELANPNHPLLRRLLLEASGTYHHAIIVANLAEAAAERIGANPILALTGAYFHDVGKLKRPQYFKENQMGDNPLHIPDPYVAAAIITSHTKDGVQLAQKYRLPLEIQQIIQEHHGDTPTMFFYHKALQMSDGKPVDIADFRYAGPRPSTKEAAIVMLADTIEAAIRSMPSHTPQSIQEAIERLVRGKLEDGQLSNCPLSLKDIDGICEAFNKVLNGVFHERIEYPKTEIPKRGAFMTEQEGGAEKTADDEEKEKTEPETVESPQTAAAKQEEKS